MGKMQSVNFHSVEDFLEFLSEEELKIVEALRKIILDVIPNCKEKLSYNVPYYSRFKRICFIWPPSIKWGSKGPKAVQLGFCTGYLLNDEAKYLERGSRKQVYIKEFKSLKEIEPDIIRSYLFDAIIVDEKCKK